MPDLSQNILCKIKEQKIKPVPKWRFIIKSILIWGLFLASLLLGAISFGVICDEMSGVDWDILNRTGNGALSFLLIAIPIFWLLSLGLFIIATIFNYQHTAHGYRHGLLLIVLISVLASAGIGYVLNQIGVAQSLNSSLDDNLPFYHSISQRMAFIWVDEDRGLIAGKILKVESTQEMLVEDLKGQTWQVMYSQAKVPSGIVFKTNQNVKIVGHKIDAQDFFAEEIKLGTAALNKAKITIIKTTQPQKLKEKTT